MSNLRNCASPISRSSSGSVPGDSGPIIKPALVAKSTVTVIDVKKHRCKASRAKTGRKDPIFVTPPTSQCNLFENSISHPTNNLQKTYPSNPLTPPLSSKRKVTHDQIPSRRGFRPHHPTRDPVLHHARPPLGHIPRRAAPSLARLLAPLPRMDRLFFFHQTPPLPRPSLPRKRRE